MHAPRRFPHLSPAEIDRLDTPGPRYTSYPTAPDWTSDFGPEDLAHAARSAGEQSPDEALSLYVHLPFCHSLCRFCGCNVIVSRDPDRVDAYLDGVARELALYAALLGPRRRLTQLHWGGGTPTFLSVAQLERLSGLVRSHFTVQRDAEVAVEVHPGHTTVEQLECLRALGFTRLSMGVQDFDPGVQAQIGRTQSLEVTATLVTAARRLGFEGVNFDLVYGLPGQTPTTWAATLERVIALRPDRLAVYSFAYLPSQRAQQRAIDSSALPRGADKLGLLEQASNALVDAGWSTIGFDHFALPTDALVRAQRTRTLGRNFQGFTVCAAPDTIACGVTGISDVGGCYAQNEKRPSRYFEALAQGRLPVERGVWLTADDQRRRRWIGRLLCNDWLALTRDEVSGLTEELDALDRLRAEGLVTLQSTTDGGLELNLTEVGRVFARLVARVFDARLRKRREDERPEFSRAV